MITIISSINSKEVSVTEARNRWIVKIILFIAIFAFIGVSILPIIETIINEKNLPVISATEQRKFSVSAERSKLTKDIKGLQLVLQREPNNQSTLRGLLERQLKLLQLGDENLQGIIKTLDKLTQINPEQTKYAVLLAQAKQQANDKDGAVQTYRSILKIEPANLEALQGIIMLLLDQKKPEAAISLLKETLAKETQANKIEPRNTDVIAIQLLLGNVYALQKSYSQAMTIYDMAIANDKQDFRPVLAKAMLLKAQGRADEANYLFNNAAKLAPPKYKDEISKQVLSEKSQGIKKPEGNIGK